MLLHEVDVRRRMLLRVWPFMRVEAMRRTRWIAVGPLLTFAALAGCSDRVVSPVEAPSIAAPASIAFAPEGRPSLDLAGGSPDSTAVDFTVGPNGGVFFTGNHAVFFPSQSICDPATSSYGPGTWDQPCSLLQTTLNVHAEVRNRNGQVWVDFKPSLRFVPSTNPARWVWILMREPDAVGATGDLSRFNILWADALGGTTVDETPLDPTLRTYVDTWQGITMRRIKHFTGYTAGAEDKCSTDCPVSPSTGG
jgi:hypothetical protein